MHSSSPKYIAGKAWVWQMVFRRGCDLHLLPLIRQSREAHRVRRRPADAHIYVRDQREKERASERVSASSSE